MYLNSQSKNPCLFLCTSTLYFTVRNKVCTLLNVTSFFCQQALQTVKWQQKFSSFKVSSSFISDRLLIKFSTRIYYLRNLWDLFFMSLWKRTLKWKSRHCSTVNFCSRIILFFLEGISFTMNSTKTATRIYLPHSLFLIDTYRFSASNLLFPCEIKTSSCLWVHFTNWHSSQS